MTYIVEEKCLNDIINFLSYERSYRNYTNGECTDLLEKLGYCLGYNDDCGRLLQDMLNLNHLAVNVCYYPDYEQYPDHYNFKHSDNPGIYQALKSIRCWQYQCMEGEPMERSKLYVTFKTIEDIIMTSVVEQIPEYQEACQY